MIGSYSPAAPDSSGSGAGPAAGLLPRALSLGSYPSALFLPQDTLVLRVPYFCSPSVHGDCLNDTVNMCLKGQKVVFISQVQFIFSRMARCMTGAACAPQGMCLGQAT